MRRYFGDKEFYKRLFAVMIPILIQNIITNFVNLLDNIMVGRIGTEPMSGVSIVNQLIFVCNLCFFGGLAGAGIFTAQFFGKGDHEGVRHTFRFKWYTVILIVILFILTMGLFGDAFINSFLHEGTEDIDIAATFESAKAYLKVIILQIPIFGITQIYASTLRETGETAVPMRAGISAVFVNLFFNWVLIFGKLGAPALGVVGAAIATVMSRVVELLIIVIWTHRHTEREQFIIGAYSSPAIPIKLVKQIIIMGMPLLVNEFLWSLGMTILKQSYSLRGIEVVSALNISSTVSNLFFCAFFAMGTTVAIMIGQLLGAGELEKAVEEDDKLLAFSVVLCAGVGVVMAVLAPLFPEIYNTSDAVKALAAKILVIDALFMPVYAYTNSCYFTLRSGGKTLITFLFDSAFVWVICIPVVLLLSRLTTIAIRPMYFCVQCLELIKCIVGFIMVKSKRWVNNLVSD